MTGKPRRSGRPRVPDDLRERWRLELVEARARSGLSLASLGRLVGMSKQAISNFEHGRTPVPEQVRAWVRGQAEDA